MTTLAQVKSANANWFAPGQKKFFGDVSYRVLHGKTTKKPYLVRSTNAWTDMFGQQKKLHWRVNPIHPDSLKIECLTDDVFDTIDDVKEWLKEN